MIYTGYFANTNKYLNNNLVTISIAGKAPSFYNGLEYKKLAPSYNLVMDWKSGTIDEFKYLERYTDEVFSKLNQKQVEAELYNMSEGKDVVLLCYEKQGDFCHRHLVADWLEKEHIRVDEYQFKGGGTK